MAQGQLGDLLDERAGVLLSLHRAAALGFEFCGIGTFLRFFFVDGIFEKPVLKLDLQCHQCQ